MLTVRMIESRTPEGKLQIACCAGTIRDGTGLPPEEEETARSFIEYELALSGCPHVQGEARVRFERDRDAGRILDRYSQELGEPRESLAARLPHWAPSC